MYSVSVLDTERADTHTPLMPNILGHYRGWDAAEAEARQLVVVFMVSTVAGEDSGKVLRASTKQWV
mgnify:CR=1 FL=1